MQQMMIRTFVSLEVALEARQTTVGFTDVPMSVYGFSDKEVALLRRRLDHDVFATVEGIRSRIVYGLRTRSGESEALMMSEPTCDVRAVRDELLAWVRSELAFEAELDAAMRQLTSHDALRKMLVPTRDLMRHDDYPAEAIPVGFMLNPKSIAGTLDRLNPKSGMKELVGPVIQLANEEESARARSAYLALDYERMVVKRSDAPPRVHEPYIRDAETAAHAAAALAYEERRRYR